jgi:hypothetical protein
MRLAVTSTGWVAASTESGAPGLAEMGWVPMDHQRIEPQHRAQPHREIEIAVLEKFEIGNEPGIRRIAAHFAKRAEPGAEGSGEHWPAG